MPAPARKRTLRARIPHSVIRIVALCALFAPAMGVTGTAFANRSTGRQGTSEVTVALHKRVTSPGVYTLRLVVATSARARSERVAVIAGRQTHRLTATRRRALVRMRLLVSGTTLTARLVGSNGRPQISSTVSGPQGSTTAVVAGQRASGSSPIAFGSYVSGVPDYPSLLDSFDSMIGRTPAVVMWYRYWNDDLFNTADLQAVTSRGAVPMVTWEPWLSDHIGIPLTGIAGGAYDSTILADANAAAAWGKPIFVRFAHEMNGDWYPWGLGVGGNTAAEYIAAWRHVVDLFRSAGATNVKWVWSPNEFDSGTPNFDQLYPGDAYVDWVGIDGYNFGTTGGNTWQSFTQILGPSYNDMLRLTSKPLMIAETGSVEQGGTKASWIKSALGSEIPKTFPRVRLVNWFDSTYAGLDWRVNSSNTSLSAFRSEVDSSLYGMSAASLLAIS